MERTSKSAHMTQQMCQKEVRMKKKTVAILCAVLVVILAGVGLLWYFFRNSGTKEDETVVYVNTVSQLTGILQGNGLQNRFAGKKK